MSDQTRQSPARLWLKAGLAWLALCLLLGATLGGAYLDIGAWKLPLAMTIAVAKAALVVVVFMELFSAGSATRFAALSGIIWLALLFALTFADEATRQHMPPGFDAESSRQDVLDGARGN